MIKKSIGKAGQDLEARTVGARSDRMATRGDGTRDAVGHPDKDEGTRGAPS
jgi:hypothetical protein